MVFFPRGDSPVENFFQDCFAVFPDKIFRLQKIFHRVNHPRFSSSKIPHFFIKWTTPWFSINKYLQNASQIEFFYVFNFISHLTTTMLLSRSLLNWLTEIRLRKFSLSHFVYIQTDFIDHQCVKITRSNSAWKDHFNLLSTDKWEWVSVIISGYMGMNEGGRGNINCKSALFYFWNMIMQLIMTIDKALRHY